ncbi:hypothetical protein B0T10DRAFT_495440 [Thelonectria olida]|uniref:F-box domain-containing protein n=1 Tax=Thelonectria olida TaxID=1576542 RepID=A0A9P8VWW1_9HYPO|nr:hypothetical protein B0T10DRAFT_495440 [Thelonectria olida]
MEYSHNLDSLCPEVTDIICSVLPTSSLRSLRLVNHHLGAIATKWAFQHIRLGAREGHSDYEHFVKVAQLKTLRPYVREVTCDTWLGPCAEEDSEFNFNLPQDFLRALPLLRCFKNVIAVHLRFSQRTKHVCTSGTDTETDDFRYRVLDTVFNCIAGTWAPETQARLDQKLFGFNFTTNYAVPPSNAAPIPIRELTVSNLADFDDKRLTDSKVFKYVLSMPSLTSLKLCITQQQVDGNCDSEEQPESAIWFREKYDMFENMPHTWLSPSIAANLRSLSLYSKDYWGWNPRMDFRAVLPGDGPESGLPQLRVLALGMYVFSHEWQFEWIASLGRMNGKGGLEEIYLDRCPIMVQARHQAPAGYGTRVVGTDASGNDVSISNEGYYLLDGMEEQDTYDADLTVQDFPLRWHHVLPRWRQTMKALKVFKMGQSSWNFAPRQTLDARRLEQTAPKKPSDEHHLKHLLHHNNFRHFDRPSPPSLTQASKANVAKYRLGTGVDEDQRFRARYIYFDITSGPSEWRDVYWPSRAHPRQPPLGDDVRQRDVDEVSRIMATVDGRRRGFKEV